MIAVELTKLFRRPRTWAMVGLLCLLPTVVAVFLAVTDVAPRPGEAPASPEFQTTRPAKARRKRLWNRCDARWATKAACTR